MWSHLSKPGHLAFGVVYLLNVLPYSLPMAGAPHHKHPAEGDVGENCLTHKDAMNIVCFHDHAFHFSGTKAQG